MEMAICAAPGRQILWKNADPLEKRTFPVAASEDVEDTPGRRKAVAHAWGRGWSGVRGWGDRGPGEGGWVEGVEISEHACRRVWGLC